MNLCRILALSLVLAAAASQPVAADPSAELDARLRVLSRPETAEGLAGYAHNLYEALLGRGFGQEQAMRLVVAFAGAGPGGACGAGDP